jgi:hypothetical protein
MTTLPARQATPQLYDQDPDRNRTVVPVPNRRWAARRAEVIVQLARGSAAIKARRAQEAAQAVPSSGATP